MRKLALAALVALATPAGAEEKPELVIYTYESFVSEWGPGPQIAANFEKECDCTVRFVGAGDGAALLGRLRLEGQRTPADIVLGLDTNLTAAAKETGLFAPHGIADPALDLPIPWEDDTFLPYDWGYFAFVYDRTKMPDPPASFEELIASDASIVIHDPRSSTPGLGLLMWVKDAYGERAPEIWQGLAPRIVTVAPGWSEAYGLFVNGEVDMALAYTTSPAYHLIADQDDTKAAAIFEEGHYMQVEVAAMTATSDQPELARRFLGFMLTDGFQGVIPTTNWMYPAHTPAAGLPAGYDTLAVPEKALLFPPEEAQAKREAALAEWLAALSR
ncbi:thiamine ABC transporter substrate binding subunit [Amaricoccus sp.]|uniref:thiamine ABC transporter substrate binding subunit n=1 Tax=Amaricoccus sp. TaxID=1872485 RepID=UPI00260ADF76|nr:thiamine ABC transporter substrate binding subunit [Amaricoccus sp.]HRO11570.1 thiamine ABC transporter substrate binding subunit [Amaricoccus sp.]